MKLPVLCLVFFALVNICSAASGLKGVSIAAPETCNVNEATIIRIEPGIELPASSFYRVDIRCPVQPDGAKTSIKSGVPESEIVFSRPGVYECEIETGFVSKSSCAAVSYKKLGEKRFRMTVNEK